MTLPCEKVLEDPRGYRLPPGYFWSRRVVNYETVGKWCIVFKSRFLEMVIEPKDEPWTPSSISAILTEAESQLAAAHEQAFKNILRGPSAGSA